MDKKKYKINGIKKKMPNLYKEKNLSKDKEKSKQVSINNIKLGKNLRKYREEMELSQEKFSELIDISKSFLEKIESGEKLMSLVTFYNTVNKLGISADSLLELDNIEKVAEKSSKYKGKNTKKD